jgi:hypothetical protein
MGDLLLIRRGPPSPRPPGVRRRIGPQRLTGGGMARVSVIRMLPQLCA